MALDFLPLEGPLRCDAITEGWSADVKYRVTAIDGGTYLLRLAPAERFEQKKRETEVLRVALSAGVNAPRSLACALAPDGRCYTLSTWMPGESLERALPRLPVRARYALGRSAGGQLRALHDVPGRGDWEDWAARFGRKIDRKLEMFARCPIRVSGMEVLAEYVNFARPLLAGRPQSYQHGDYHVGNLLLTPEGGVAVIDFDRADVGDPWEEFNRITWCYAISPAFAAGRVDGYFGDGVPGAFWALLRLYIASDSLGAITWAIPFGQGEIDVMRRKIEALLPDYEQAPEAPPAWYAKGKCEAK